MIIYNFDTEIDCPTCTQSHGVSVEGYFDRDENYVITEVRNNLTGKQIFPTPEGERELKLEAEKKAQVYA